MEQLGQESSQSITGWPCRGICVFPDEEHSGVSLCPTQQWGSGRVQVSWLRPLSSYLWLTCLWGSVGRGLQSVMAHGDTLSPSLALHTSQESGPQ